MTADLRPAQLFHAFQNGPDDAANNSGLRGFLTAAWHVLHQLVRELRDGQRLQPHSSRPGERGEKDALAAEDHVANAGDARDLKRHGSLEGANVSRMDAQQLAGSEVLDDQLARELEPCDTLSAHLLQQEAVAAEDTRAKRLLKAHAQ